MAHLPLHLPRELFWCTLVHAWWMYSVERYLGHLKGLVLNKARQEGIMAMGFMYKEALRFVTKDFRLFPVCARFIWNMDKAPKDVLRGAGKTWP